MSVPIQFHVGSFRLNWEIERDDKDILFVGRCVVNEPMEHIPTGDAWELVRQYLSVDAGNEQSVLKFLAVTGEFGVPKGSMIPRKFQEPRVYSISRGTRDQKVRVGDEMVEEMVLESFSLREFAIIQDYVRRILTTGNPVLPTPWRSTYVQRYEIAFSETRSGPRAHVSVSHTFSSVLATIQFKLVQGAKFRTCARKDCGLPFELTSRHARRFCTQYCAHITALRRRRKMARKARKQRRSEHETLAIARRDK